MTAPPARYCPLCRQALGQEGAVVRVPVSPVVYPGHEGLEVHAGCLAAARRGAFERPHARSPVAALTATLLASSLVGSGLLLWTGLPPAHRGWGVPLLLLFLLPVLAPLALGAAAWLTTRLPPDVRIRPGRP